MSIKSQNEKNFPLSGGDEKNISIPTWALYVIAGLLISVAILIAHSKGAF